MHCQRVRTLIALLRVAIDHVLIHSIALRVSDVHFRELCLTDAHDQHGDGDVSRTGETASTQSRALYYSNFDTPQAHGATRIIQWHRGLRRRLADD